MIFSIGFLAFIIAIVCDWDRPKWVSPNLAVAIIGLAGIALMLLSVGIVAWRAMP